MSISAEQIEQITGWNQTTTDYPRTQTVHGLFEAQAAATPDAIALDYQGATLSYAELNRRANQLAHYLQARGVGPEVLVGLYLERSLEMIVALLGILKAGGAYLPLDPDYPQSRLALMLEDAGVPVLLCLSSVGECLPDFAGERVYLDNDWASIARESTHNPVSAATADNLIYVIYTSGSTGRPKGTLIEHHSVVRLVKQTDYVDFGPDEVFLQFAPISFDASTFEIWGSLLNGGKLLLFPAGRAALEELGQFIQQKGITTMWLTSALFSQMVDNHLSSLAGVRQLLAGGDVLPLPQVKKVLQQLGEGRLINGYGPTENTTFTCCHVMTASSVVDQSVPIGRPISNTTVYILDDQMTPVPVGTAGELYIGGAGLARGYLNQPELTAEKFVANPFDDDPASRLYRTGDKVRVGNDGAIEFIGRFDNQVKLRGFRIEPGEIEAAIRGHGGVSDAVVSVMQGSSGDPQLVAHVVGDSNGFGCQVSELREYLQQKLPPYMLPAFFVPLDALPLTPNGKVDRRSLPPPDSARPQLSSKYIAPRNELEQKLAAIWEDVLGLEQIGVEDQFPELGGQSLLATRIVTRIREMLGVELSLADFYQDLNVAKMALRLERAGPAAEAKKMPVICPAPRDQPIPVTFPQERVVFLTQLTPDSLASNTQMSIRFTGQLDVPALQRSLNEIVRRHEIFRTSFDIVDGRPQQRIHPDWGVHLSLMDLSDLPENQRNERRDEAIDEVILGTFDIEAIPLVRWKLIKLADEEHLLIHVEHHLIHDGWSFGVFTQELQALYEAYSQGRESPLPELPVQFADYAIWQRQWMQGETLQALLEYWKEKLAPPLPVLQLPMDFQRPPVQSHRGAEEVIDLDPEIADQLRGLVRREHSSLYVTTLTVFLVLLHKYSQQQDIVIGSSVANRNHREIESLIGMIVNIIALRADLSGDPTFRDLVKRTHDMAFEVYAYQDLPFEKLVEELQIDRDLAYNPLYQVLFGFHDSHVATLNFPGVSGHIDYLHNNSSKFDLSLVFYPWAEQQAGVDGEIQERRITMKWEYATDLFTSATIRRMARHYQNLVRELIQHPDKCLSELSVFSEAEHRHLLQEWNQTATDYPREMTVHELFEAQAAATPDSIAIVYQGEEIRYAQLNERSNQLARYLQARGVGPETRVGLYLQRGVEMIVGLLGIIKAGGAYLPLDPDYPVDRLNYMLEDSGAELLLSMAGIPAGLAMSERQVVCLGRDAAAIAKQGRANPPPRATADDLAYVIYTSGSTGKPKGVMGLHRGVVNRLHWGWAAYPYAADERCCQKTTLNFVDSVAEIFSPLLAGIGLVVADEATLQDVRALARLVSSRGVTRLLMVPSLLRALLDLDEETLGGLGGVRYWVTSGERLEPELEDMFRARYPGAVLLNFYGSSEVAADVTCFDTAERGERGGSLIGRPIANLRVYVLDDWMNPVPLGVPGELYVGGDGLARGYLHRPELTAEKFVPDPFSDEPGARLYRTGDRVRYLVDGNLEFLGRSDDQVKLRGFRIELGEIESALIEQESIREAVAIVREDEPGDKQLVGYVVPTAEWIAQYLPAEGDDKAGEPRYQEIIAELREQLRQQLPAYMIPAVFVVLEALPLNPNGKVERRALPVPSHVRANQGAEYSAPRNAMERQLASIWAEILKLERVGIHDKFFDLGGHSLLATQVVSRIRAQLNVELPLSKMFSYPTLAELTPVVESLLDDSQGQRAEILQRIRNISAQEKTRLLAAARKAKLHSHE